MGTVHYLGADCSCGSAGSALWTVYTGSSEPQQHVRLHMMCAAKRLVRTDCVYRLSRAATTRAILFAFAACEGEAAPEVAQQLVHALRLRSQPL